MKLKAGKSSKTVSILYLTTLILKLGVFVYIIFDMHNYISTVRENKL